MERRIPLYFQKSVKMSCEMSEVTADVEAYLYLSKLSLHKIRTYNQQDHMKLINVFYILLLLLTHFESF